ncbi:MAG: hypothetical protein ABII03_00165 [Nanoarchaeota archaeon]|nr:hypothetical protein [Nanoarchaeota archaeon]
MEKKFQVMLTFAALIVLVAGLYIFTNWFSIITGYFTGESEQARLAQCLQKQGAELYSSDFCSECEQQKTVFGKSFAQINYIDCGKEKENCPNIQQVPAWFIPNSEEKIHYGLKTLNELKNLAGCENDI